ncbi:hypothetical protein PVAP13_3KG042300 [Panicum virgatum]|uniref:Bifunctional inhibitor/plant lipid transfer protein/seed storage helical domain-containing protein n=1 Tax=Panicum virgatum TaxID=38727 RepID=A0A8T0UQW7_PANVG|nr:hypothetical protein PVAP13_3KG042300 [Panicum virgatum]
MARRLSVSVVVLVAALVAAETASAAVSCGEVTSAVAPCLGYAMGSSASPSAACCNGVRLGGNMRNAASIPSKCGVNVGVPISPNVDCSKIN